MTRNEFCTNDKMKTKPVRQRRNKDKTDACLDIQRPKQAGTKFALNYTVQYLKSSPHPFQPLRLWAARQPRPLLWQDKADENTRS